tara:strand:- start:460 stop:720 length:261 start_codon:yes stop_codon:yes gene_type:complete
MYSPRDYVPFRVILEHTHEEFSKYKAKRDYYRKNTDYQEYVLTQLLKHQMRIVELGFCPFCDSTVENCMTQYDQCCSHLVILEEEE